MAVVVDEALNYEKMDHSYGSYMLSRVTQQSDTLGGTLDGSGGNESIFEIPAKVVNFSKSHLEFQLTIPLTATKSHWINMDGISMIRQIQLYTRTRTYLCDINDLDRYSNMLMRRTTLSYDGQTYDKAASGSGFNEGLQACNKSAATNYRSFVSGAVGKTEYLEPLYNIITAVGVGGNIKYKICLDKVKNSILAENKDLYFGGELLYLRIVWGPRYKVFFDSPSITDPDPNGTDATEAAVNITMSNLLLLLAIETNPMIENMIKAKVQSTEGLSLLIPMVYYNRQNLPATVGGIHGITTRYNRAHGIKLKKIYWAPYNTEENINFAFDHNCAGGALKIAQFYTQINSVRTSQYDYNLANGDDWAVKRLALKGTNIYSSDEYYYNWVWEEDFTDNNLFWKKVFTPENNMIDGLDLTTEIKYDINATIGAAPPASITHFVYAVTEKLLTIGQDIRLT